MISEMTIGEMPMETSFVGASAAPSQAPAAKPKECRATEVLSNVTRLELLGETALDESGGHLLRSENQRMNRRRSNPAHQHSDGDPKVDIAEHAAHPVACPVRFSVIRA